MRMAGGRELWSRARAVQRALAVEAVTAAVGRLLLLIGLSAQLSGAWTLPQAAGKVDRDVTYCSPGGVDQKMDIYYPQTRSDKAAPVAMFVHGGGWRAGNKGGGAGLPAVPLLTGRGYLVAAVNYRLAPEYKFPAQIEDVKCAVRFLRAHAKDYNLDPKRIGAFGGSAGGHLVALLGTADASAGFEGDGGFSGQSSRVQAVVDMFGPTDLTAAFGKPNNQLGMLGRIVFGAESASDPVFKKASPVTYATKDDPPFLILQGEEDTLVPPEQSKILYDKLKATGVPATLVRVKHAGHGFKPVGGQPDPSVPELMTMIADFFDRYLKPSAAAPP